MYLRIRVKVKREVRIRPGVIRVRVRIRPGVIRVRPGVIRVRVRPDPKAWPHLGSLVPSSRGCLGGSDRGISLRVGVGVRGRG